MVVKVASFSFAADGWFIMAMNTVIEPMVNSALCSSIASITTPASNR